MPLSSGTNYNTEYMRKWRAEHPEEYKQKNKKYYWENRERMLSCHKIHHRKIKLEALQKISNKKTPECIYCGCKDIRVLEINHKNGRGYKERKTFVSGTGLMRKIAKGERKIDDLEVACKLCNVRYYLEKKYDLYWKIVFSGEISK